MVGMDIGMIGMGMGMVGMGMGMVGVGIGMIGMDMRMVGMGMGMVGVGIGMIGMDMRMVGMGMGMVGMGVLVGMVQPCGNSEGVAISQPRVEACSASTLGIYNKRCSNAVSVALSRRRYPQQDNGQEWVGGNHKIEHNAYG